MREWFAGLALSNAELMRGVAAVDRAAEAVRLADQLMSALGAPRVPSVESMAEPNEDEMQRWDDHVAEKRRRDATPTVRPGLRRASSPFRHTLPPPDPDLASANHCFQVATGALRRASQTSAPVADKRLLSDTRYTVLEPTND